MRHRKQAPLAWSTAVIAALAIAAPAAVASPGVALRDSQSPAAARTPSVGSVPGATRMDFEVDLKLTDQAGAEALAQAVATPGNAAYGHYLTPAQWEARFSPTAGDVAQVRSFLTRSGLAAGAVSADRTAITVSGTAQQVEHAFGTSLSYHRVQGARRLLADRALSVPASIAGIVGGVTGVNQTVATPDNTLGGPAASPQASANAPQPPGFRVGPPCGTYSGQRIDFGLPQFPGYNADPPWAVCGYTGPQFRSAYHLSGSANGAGVTVAIVDAYASPTLLSDAHQFAALNDPSNPLKASQFSELLAGNFNLQGICEANGWYGEETLDVEAVHDTAPGANILVGAARNCLTTGLNNTLRRIVDGHLASVISNSYGDDGGDVLDSADDRQSTDNILLMADATGVSVMFSSGDDGDEFTTVGAVAADYPASSPYATAVGGTTLQIGSAGQRIGEFGWSTGRAWYCNGTAASAAVGICTSDQLGTWLPVDPTLPSGGGGGGTSVVYPQPAWQKGVVPAALSQRNGSAPMRVEPDISMEGDPATGMLVGETQTFPEGVHYDQYRIGGTSVASPLMAGVVARADQLAGRSLGFLNPKLYAQYGSTAALDDVTATHQVMSRSDFANSLDSSEGFLFSSRVIDYQGQEEFCDLSTNQCSTRQVALSATPGYDSMTGLGSPGPSFVPALSQR